MTTGMETQKNSIFLAGYCSSLFLLYFCLALMGGISMGGIRQPVLPIFENIYFIFAFIMDFEKKTIMVLPEEGNVCI